MKKRILIIDDETDFTLGVKINLESTDKYEVRTESEGRNVISVIQKFNPDLIFLDVIMPDMDGSEVMSLIKANASFKYIPVVFLTAIATRDEVGAETSFIGGYPFLSKPISKADLIECIEQNTR